MSRVPRRSYRLLIGANTNNGYISIHTGHLHSSLLSSNETLLRGHAEAEEKAKATTTAAAADDRSCSLYSPPNFDRVRVHYREANCNFAINIDDGDYNEMCFF